MPPIPNLALAIKALISFVVLGVSITAINAVAFPNDVYTKGSTGIFFTPPVSTPAVEFGQTDCPTCLFADLENVRLAPTPTLPLKISWAAPSMVRPKLSPTSIAPSPRTTNTAPTLPSKFSKAEEFTLWCKKLSPSIFRRDAAWIIVGGMISVIFVTASTYILLHRLPSLRSYLGNAKDIGRSILCQSLAILMALLRERFAGPTILAFAIFRHLELSYYIELERRSEWKAEWKAAMKQRFINEGNARLNDIFWEWQVAEEKRIADWKVIEKTRILDKTNTTIEEHTRHHVRHEKRKIFRKVADVVDRHRRGTAKEMRSELQKLWATEFNQVDPWDSTSQGGAQQSKTDQRLPIMESTSKQKREGEAQQPNAAYTDSEQAAEANEKYEEVVAPKSEVANVSSEVTHQVKDDGAEAHPSQTVSEFGADMSRPIESLDEGEARGSEHPYGVTEQTRNLDDDGEKADVQQSEGAHVSQNLAIKLEEGRDDGNSQRPEDADAESEQRAQIDIEKGTRVPRNQNMEPKPEGNKEDPVIEDVREQANKESATWRALNKELEENVAGLYRMIVNTEDDSSSPAKASEVRRSVQEGAEVCIKWYDAQISLLKDATEDPKSSSPDLDSDVTPPDSATTTKEDKHAWYTKRLSETQVHMGRLAKIIDYEKKRLTMKQKIVSFGSDLRTSNGSFGDMESKNDKTGHEEAHDRPSSPKSSHPAETEVQSQGKSKTKKRNLERKRAKANKVKEMLESQNPDEKSPR